MPRHARGLAMLGTLAALVSAPAAAQSVSPSAPASSNGPTLSPDTVLAAHAIGRGDEREVTAPMPSLMAAVKGMPRDVWHFVSLDTAKIVGVGLGAALPAHHWDDAALEELQEDAGFADFVSSGNTYGSFAVQAGGALGTYLAGRWTGHPALAHLGVDVVRAQVVTQAWVQAVKFSVNRMRPDGTRFSFPSGHVASTFATAGVVQRELGWKAGLPMSGLGSTSPLPVSHRTTTT